MAMPVSQTSVRTDDASVVPCNRESVDHAISGGCGSAQPRIVIPTVPVKHVGCFIKPCDGDRRDLQSQSNEARSGRTRVRGASTPKCGEPPANIGDGSPDDDGQRGTR